MERIIERDRSIIPACDVTFDVFKEIVKQLQIMKKLEHIK